MLTGGERLFLESSRMAPGKQEKRKTYKSGFSYNSYSSQVEQGRKKPLAVEEEALAFPGPKEGRGVWEAVVCVLDGINSLPQVSK